MQSLFAGNQQDRAASLHHFLRDSQWSVEQIRETRLWLTKLLIGEQEIILIIDETGDQKKRCDPLKGSALFSTERPTQGGEATSATKGSPLGQRKCFTAPT